MGHPTSVDRLDLGDHVCWTFDHEGERLDAMARFVAAGIRDGHKTIYYTETYPPDALLAEFRSRGVAVDEPAQSGQLEVRAAGEAYRTDGRFIAETALASLAEQISLAHRDGFPGVRVTGDMAWAHTTDLPQLTRYEAQANLLFAAGQAMGLCQYDRRHFAPDNLRLAGSSHPATTWTCDSEWAPMLRMQRTFDPPGLRLHGELDISNSDALSATLTGLAEEQRHRPTPATLVIDASGLTFADVSAAGALIAAAGSAPAGLQVKGASAALARVLKVIGAGRAGAMLGAEAAS